MRRQTRRTTVVREARSVIEVRCNPSPTRQIHIPSHAERVLLVMVQQEKPSRRSEESKTTCSLPPPFSPLAGIRQVHLAATQNHRRPQSYLPPIYTSPLQGQRKKDIRVAQSIVIEKVSALGVEVIAVQR